MAGPYRFNLPGVGIGVGYLIHFGGISQFSIAFERDIAPERVTVAAAIQAGMLVDDRAIQQYDITGEDVNKPSLSLKPEFAAAEAAAEQNSQTTAS